MITASFTYCVWFPQVRHSVNLFVCLLPNSPPVYCRLTSINLCIYPSVLQAARYDLWRYPGEQGRVGPKRYQCRFCSYSTDYSTNRLHHERCHTGDRPFRCPRCSKAFSRKDHLKRHKQGRCLPCRD